MKSSHKWNLCTAGQGGEWVWLWLLSNNNIEYHRGLRLAFGIRNQVRCVILLFVLFIWKYSPPLEHDSHRTMEGLRLTWHSQPGTLCCFTFSLCAFHMKILTNTCIFSHAIRFHLKYMHIWLALCIWYVQAVILFLGTFIWNSIFISKVCTDKTIFGSGWRCVDCRGWFFFGRLLQCYFGDNVQWHNNFLMFRPMLFHWILHSDCFCGAFPSVEYFGSNFNNKKHFGMINSFTFFYTPYLFYNKNLCPW
jgi:hypothetical protein